MPLPPNASYALQNNSRPGETIQSKPKRAMLLRLSTEVLNLFDAFPPNAPPEMEFLMGDNPGLKIGDSFFPLHSQKEDICHELYLRSASALKPYAPLRLYANVTGKLTVPERELDPELQARIHKRTADVAEQRSVSKTKFIETPPDLPPPNAKKKKDPSSMFRKPVKASDQPKSGSLATSRTLPPRPHQASPSTHPPQRQAQDNAAVPLRKRLIHYIAVAERTTEDTLKAVGGSNCDSNTRQDILEAMHQVAEQVSSSKNSQRIWRLKPEAWLDVRPYEWPKLSEADRTSLARAARLNLKSLNIPESDPAWGHVKYRAPSNGGPPRADSPAPIPSTSASTSAPAPKRGVSSTEVKGKKARKTDPKTEIMIKDESKPRPGTSSEKAGASTGKTGKVPPPPLIASSSSSKSSTTSGARLSPATRKPPGSGFKLNKTSETKTVDASLAVARDNGDVQMKDGTRRTSEVKVRKDDRQSLSQTSSEARVRKDDRLSSSANGRGIGNDDRPAPVNRVKHLREESMDSDRERGRGSTKEKEKSKERISSQESSRYADVSSLKRKKAKQDDDFDYEEESLRVPGTKRRKTEEGMERLAPMEARDRERDSSRPSKPIRDAQLPKKPQTTSANVAVKAPKKEPSPLPKIKKEPSPLPKFKKEPSPLPPQNGASSSRNSTVKNGSRRRRSPIYTSSEDEGEIQSNPRSSALPLLTPPTTTPSSLDSRHSNSRSTTHGGALPTDHAGLRTRYTSSYVKYLESFQTLLTQKGEIERLLEREASLSGSDGDVELLDYEGLSKIVGENKKWWEELQSIQQAYKRVD